MKSNVFPLMKTHNLANILEPLISHGRHRIDVINCCPQHSWPHQNSVVTKTKAIERNNRVKDELADHFDQAMLF